MKLLSIFTFLLLSFTSSGQALTVQTFGNPENEALLFLHGGPGYNSVVFEQTSAQALADAGFFVISYDRRGEGRAVDLSAAYTFSESIADINQMLQELKIEKLSLLGHSFGGILATEYATAHPEKVKAIFLMGAPIDLQESFKHILVQSKKIYEEKKDAVNLNYLSMLEKMDTASFEYASYCFMHAMQNGFYNTKVPTKDAQRIFPKFATDSLLQKYASKMDYEAPQAFWKNEQYTTLNLKDKLTIIGKANVKIYGIYGKEDGLYSPAQIDDLQQSIGTANMAYLEACSHNVFVDQQEKFINLLKAWLP
ncbi:MAG: alpha/beta fold hydrolase [Saprospiraceae bacterium]